MSLMCTFLAIFLPGSNAVVSLPTFREHLWRWWNRRTHGEIWNWWNHVKQCEIMGRTCMFAGRFSMTQQHDQNSNKLVKIPVSHVKLVETLCMKPSKALQSETARSSSSSSVNLWEISGSGVLLLEWTMCKQRPSTSSTSPTRSFPSFSRSFSMKGASSAKARLG